MLTVNSCTSSHQPLFMCSLLLQDGYIVTNAHVVEAARVGGVVEVTMCNGRKFSGVVWGMDRGSDIALIKVDEKQAGGMLPTAIIGDSSVLRAGEFVVAVSELGMIIHLFAVRVTSLSAWFLSCHMAGGISSATHEQRYFWNSFIACQALVRAGDGHQVQVTHGSQQINNMFLFVFTCTLSLLLQFS